MYYLKAFGQFSALTNNALGVISNLGELSTNSLTFTKERTEHTDIAYPGLTLVAFSSKDSSISSPTPVSTSFQVRSLEMMSTVYTYCKNSVGKPVINNLLISILNSLAGKVSDLEAGALVSTNVNGTTLWMPEWISWAASNLGGNQIKIWFSNEAFQNQYDEYELVVIPPVSNLNVLFSTEDNIQEALDARPISALINLAQAAKDGHPETLHVAESYMLYPPSEATYRPMTTWQVLIYGKQGNNPDAIREAIRVYALDNSTYLEQDWRDLLPDVFRVTEFTILPRWDKISVPERQTASGVYSPISKPAETLEYTKNLYSDQDPQHLDLAIRVLPHVYRSIGLVVFGGSDNREDKFSITDFYPDYIAVGTGSTDFSRMGLSTQQWSTLVQRLLIAAESGDSGSALPVGMRRVTRSGLTHVVESIQNIQFMVPLRAEVLADYEEL